jgi:hypothetical protein
MHANTVEEKGAQQMPPTAVLRSKVMMGLKGRSKRMSERIRE